ENRSAGQQRAAALPLGDHPGRGTVLDGAARVLPFEFRVKTRARRLERLETHERRVADQREHRRANGSRLHVRSSGFEVRQETGAAHSAASAGSQDAPASASRRTMRERTLTTSPTTIVPGRSVSTTPSPRASASIVPVHASSSSREAAKTIA